MFDKLLSFRHHFEKGWVDITRGTHNKLWSVLLNTPKQVFLDWSISFYYFVEEKIYRVIISNETYDIKLNIWVLFIGPLTC